jgi:hypothetical protein
VTTLEERLQVADDAITEAMKLLPAKMDSPEARVLLLAIQRQEDPEQKRYQVGPVRDGRWSKGPARGLWQFERGGGVLGVMRHPLTRDMAKSLCDHRMVEFDSKIVWRHLEHDDVLAAGFARLLPYTDPKPLPRVDSFGLKPDPVTRGGWLVDPAGSWAYYIRNWRPGKPHPEKWADNHEAAKQFVLHKMLKEGE